MATITYNGITYTYNTSTEGYHIGNQFTVQMSGTGTARLAGCIYELNGNSIVIDLSDYLAAKYAATNPAVNMDSNPCYSSATISVPIANTTINVDVVFGMSVRPYNRMPVCLPRVMEIPTTSGFKSTVYFDSGTYTLARTSGINTNLTTGSQVEISTTVKYLKYTNGVFTRITRPRLVPVCELQNKVWITWIDICGNRKSYMFDMANLEYAFDDEVELFPQLSVSHGATSPAIDSYGVHGTRSINLTVIARNLLPYERYYLMDLSVSPKVYIYIFDEGSTSSGSSYWIYYGKPSGDGAEVDFSEDTEEDIEFEFTGFPANYY